LARKICAISLCLLPVFLFWEPLAGLTHLSLTNNRFSHIAVIPFLSIGLMYLRRRQIFTRPQFCVNAGSVLLVAGIVLGVAARWLSLPLSANNSLSVAAMAIVIVWVAGFILCFGIASFKAAAFPLLLLLLIVPLPAPVLDQTVSILQKGTAETVDVLLWITGVPFLRQGLTFTLPDVAVEIAEQCSGIRSTMALFITGLLAGHLTLPSTWQKFFFSLLAFPIAIFKNAARIVTISWLGINVNPGFFHGRLHEQGGYPFSVLALAILATILLLLRYQSGRAENYHPLRQE
jgi:exosortase